MYKLYNAMLILIIVVVLAFIGFAVYKGWLSPLGHGVAQLGPIRGNGEKGRLNGSIVSSDSTQLPPVKVRLYRFSDSLHAFEKSPCDSLMIDSKGKFSFRKVQSGLYIMQVTAFGYWDMKQQVEYDSEVEKTLPAITLRKANLYKGIVQDNRGFPLANATLSLNDDKHDVFTTGKDGSFVMYQVPPSISFLLTKPHYRSVEMYLDVEHMQNNDLRLIMMPEKGSPRQSGGYGTVSGFVHDSKGRGLNNLRITCTGLELQEGNPARRPLGWQYERYAYQIPTNQDREAFRPYTDNYNGYYVITGVRKGLNNFYITLPDYNTCHAMAEILPGEEIVINPVLSRKPPVMDNVYRKYGGVLKGRILDENGKPLNQVLVRCTMNGNIFQDMGEYTNANGDYIIRNLNAGDYRLVLSRSSHNQVIKQITIKDRETTVGNATIRTNTDDEQWLSMFLQSPQGRLVARK